MVKITSNELAAVCGGKLLHPSEEVCFTGVSTDSRTVKRGDVFFAIRGENYDGHTFIDGAFKGGACGAVVSSNGLEPRCRTILLVEDTVTALQQLAAWWRQKFALPLVGITGSSGKTTTKDILSSLLGAVANVHSSTGNQNNELGVPLTLLGLTENHQVCVLEMGMRGLGEIRELCAVAMPTAGIITNVGSTHFERLGSLENIALAKGELAASLSADGFLMLNAENKWSSRISSMTSARSVLFGFWEKAEIRASQVDFGVEGTEFTLTAFGGSQRLRMPLWGEHNVYNCLAAIGTYLFLGFPMEQLQEGLNNLSITEMRLEKTSGIKGTTIINDAYNANPSSMLASLEVLKQVAGKRRVAVLGDMLELGDIAEAEHRKVGEAAVLAQVDLLITVGDLAAFISEAALAVGMERGKVFYMANVEEAAELLQNSLCMGDVVLVKGSRGMKLERIVAALQAPVEGHV